MTGDETCHCAYQRTWGTKREHYPDVMFQYSPPSERRPIERVGNLTFGGLVVIDFVGAHVEFLRPSRFYLVQDLTEP